MTLRFLTRAICLTALAVTAFAIMMMICYPEKVQHAQFTARLQYFSYYTQQIGLAIMALFIAFKARGDKGTYLIACFWAALVLNNVIVSAIIEYPIAEAIVNAITSAIVAPLFIYSMQYFPNQVTIEAIKGNIKNKPLRAYLTWLLKPINKWLYFAGFIMVLYFVLDFFKVKLQIADILTIATALMFMVINYRKPGAKGRNSILWLFWGILTILLLTMFFDLLKTFNITNNPLVDVVYSFLSTFVILASLFMSIFFADSFNTGIIIKRTLVDGLLFLIVILFYNTVEHFALHTINEYFGISDAFSSSLLSGVLVLILSPLHHRLSNFLDHKLKRFDEHRHAH